MKTSRVAARILHTGVTIGRAAADVAVVGYYLGKTTPHLVGKWCREVRKEYRAIRFQSEVGIHSNVKENTVVIDGRTNEVVSGKEVL